LENAYNLLENDWIIFMTNWALESDLNREKYKDSKISGSTNEFWSSDFNIKIWEFSRFYHSFNLKELEHLVYQNGFELIENREFEWGKNIISVMKKK
jgi:hypothetical protein